MGGGNRIIIGTWDGGILVTLSIIFFLHVFCVNTLFRGGTKLQRTTLLTSGLASSIAGCYRWCSENAYQSIDALIPQGVGACGRWLTPVLHFFWLLHHFLHSPLLLWLCMTQIKANLRPEMLKGEADRFGKEHRQFHEGPRCKRKPGYSTETGSRDKPEVDHRHLLVTSMDAPLTIAYCQGSVTCISRFVFMPQV